MAEEQSIRQRYAVFDNQKFKEDVQDYRLRQGMTREVLADAAGIDANTYYSWLRDGSRYLSLPSVVALAAFCDLSIDDYVRKVKPEFEPKKPKSRSKLKISIPNPVINGCMGTIFDSSDRADYIALRVTAKEGEKYTAQQCGNHWHVKRKE